MERQQTGEAGCIFSLYPMDSGFVPIILGALEQADTSAVAAESGALSTVYTGGLDCVVDAVRALFIGAFRPGVHMALEGQLSGPPGSGGKAPPNAARIRDIHFPALCKYSLFLWGGDVQAVAEQVRSMAEKAGLQPVPVHTATRVAGEIHSVFDFLEAACACASGGAERYVLAFTISVNSPTKEE